MRAAALTVRADVALLPHGATDLRLRDNQGHCPPEANATWSQSSPGAISVATNKN